MDKNILRLSPLTEATFYILLALNSPLHGYGIIKKVEVLTNKRLRLAPGTLYGAIKTMLDNKLIRFISEDKQRKGKKVYEITVIGRKLIYYEIKRLKEMVNNGIEQIDDYYE